MTGVIPRRPQVLRARRPQRLAGLVLEDDPGAEGRRGPFTRGQVSFRHTSIAPSSRSTARRAPSWQVHPRRRSRYQIPGIVYRHPELRGDQVADPGQRPPLVLPSRSQPARPPAPGPAPPAAAASSRHRAACPLRRQPGRAAGLPGLPPPPHRPLADTRSSAAIPPTGARCSNLSTTASRTCSRRLRPSAVSPPPCAYRIYPAYRRKPRVSPTDITN